MSDGISGTDFIVIHSLISDTYWKDIIAVTEKSENKTNDLIIEGYHPIISAIPFWQRITQS